MATDGTATTQTVVASDPEGFPIEYSYDTNPSTPAQATISNTAGAFTITPSTTEADAGDFILRYKATDGLHTTSRSTTYTLTFYTNPDIANASSDNNTFSFTTEENSAWGLCIKPDGIKLYMVGISNETVHQYTMSTAWDVSTLSYDNVSFSVANEDGSPREVTFKPDGTKMYIMGSAEDKVFQYDLSTAWDLSTAAYNSVSLSVSAQDNYPTSIQFNPWGTKMFLAGSNTDKVYEYDLSTGFDLSTATYNNVYFHTAMNVGSFAIKTDGSKLYLLSYSNDDVYTYSV